jgi:hypothetical protein
MDQLSTKKISKAIKTNLCSNHGVPTLLIFCIQTDEVMWAEAKVQMAQLSNIKKHIFQFDVEQINPNLCAFQKLKEMRFEEKA